MKVRFDKKIKTALSEYHAIKLLAGSFALLIVLGAILLWLPFSAKNGSLSFVDSLFTATSAVCVTGLTVKDMSFFSPLGQGIILALIQFGGLGIMTFASFFLVLFGQKLAFGNRLIFKDFPIALTRKNIFRVLKHMLFFSLSFELAGAVFLGVFVFSCSENSQQIIWTSLFHSVSAFCNAGFSLYSTSLTSMRSSMMLNVIIIILIIAGGLGFVIYEEVYQNIKSMFRKRKRTESFSTYTKIVLITTVILILIGSIGFFVLEKNNIRETTTVSDMVLVSVFQSVTARTAGFNTIDIASLSTPSILMLIVLMFIGGAPFSCAGGVKVTTFAVIFLVVISSFRKRYGVTCFNRKISSDVIYKTAVLLFMSIMLILAAVFFIVMFEKGGESFQEAKGAFLEIVFEVVSAFATVGLSMGDTASYCSSSKYILIVLMYIGRLGPLTLGVLLTARSKKELYECPETNILIG